MGDTPSLGAIIAFPKRRFSAQEPMQVTFALKNLGADSAIVVSPFAMPEIVSFRVAGPDGRELLFVGPRPKLAQLTRDAFVRLPPGGEVQREFDLGQAYAFTDAGPHSVTAIYRNSDDGRRFGYSAVRVEGLESNTVVIDVENRRRYRGGQLGGAE